MKNKGYVKVYYQDLDDLGGDWYAAGLLSWFRRWQTKNPDGFSIKMSKIQKSLRMTRRRVEASRKKLVDKGYLEECIKGLPPTLYFTLTDKAFEALNDDSDVYDNDTTLSTEAYATTSQQPYAYSILEDITNKESLPQENPEPTPSQDEIKTEISSSEFQFAQRMKNGNVDYSNKVKYKSHLTNLIGYKAIERKDIKGDYLRWYKDYGEEFVETAWQESKNLAQHHYTQSRIKCFVDLFTDFSHSDKLKAIIKKQADGDAKIHSAGVACNFSQGDKVEYRNECWQVRDVIPMTGMIYLDNGAEWLQAKISDVSPVAA